jgi:hypothetical protein
VKNRLWKRLWTCRKADYGINEYQGRYCMGVVVMQLLPLRDFKKN